MNREILVLIILMFAALVQGCIFSSSEPGVCGTGTLEFTRFSVYNELDSLSEVIVIDKNGDTTSSEKFEYGPDGNLKRDVWIYGTSSKDTSCTEFGPINEYKQVRGYDCSDIKKTFSITTLDSFNRPYHIEYFLGDTSVSNELFNIYDQNGYLVQVNIKQDGITTTRGKIAYDAKGMWTETVEFNSSGEILSKTTNKKIGPFTLKDSVYDKNGKYLRWEIVHLNEKEKEKKAVSCKSN